MSFQEAVQAKKGLGEEKREAEEESRERIELHKNIEA